MIDINYKKDMNKRQNVDSIIKSHSTIISDATTLNSKIIYSINCLLNNIEYQNNNRYANIIYLHPTLTHIISIAEKMKEISEDHLKCLLRFINTILSERNVLMSNDVVSLISVIMNTRMNSSAMGQDLCHEIVSLCSKIKNQGESSKLLLQLMANKMSPEQSLTLIDSFRKNELYITEVYQLISLGTHYNKNQQILRRVFQGLHWQISNVLSHSTNPSKQSKQIINFIKLTLNNNINNIKIVSLCALIYRQMVDSFKIVDKNLINKNLDYFLRTNALQTIIKPYLVESDKLISTFADLSPILQSQISVQANKHLHYLLNYYSANTFPWREQLLSSQTNGKGSIAKELLLRATQHFSVESRVGKTINEKQELVYSNFLPIECLRSLISILNKLHKEPTPHNALQTIGFFHNLPKNHPQFNEILLLLLEIYLKNRQFSSLQQVQKLIKDEISGDLVVKKLKEKGSIKDRDSNKQSKRYFICIPLVCTRTETQSLSQELSSIFIHQTVHIALKVYVANFVISKMILNPTKTFMSFLLRYVESSFSNNLLKLFLFYLQPHSVQNNPAVSQWYSKYFSQITQKLLQFLFSKLVIRQISETSKLLFLLQKFNVFGQNWINSYRWILNSLQDINQIYSDHTIDCLQIFQMIIEKIAISKIPQSVIQRFQKIILKNWSKYTQQHLYAIQRIVTLLNQHSYLGFKQITLPPLQKISKDSNIDYPTNYISNLTFNLFFSHIDIDKAFQSLLSLCEKNRENLTESAVLAAINLLLFLFQGSEEPVSPKADQFIIQTIAKFQNSHSIQGKCLQYLSRVPHNINILKIPLLSLTMQAFYNTTWINNLTQLLNIVTQLKPKAIGAYKLQQVLKSMMVYLISSENLQLIDSLMDYLQGTCFIEGDYQQTLEQCLPAMENVLIAERYGVDYRKNLVQFVLGTLIDYQYELNQENLWFLMSKYASQGEIILLILQYFQKFTIKDQLLHEKLLMRVVLIHTQNDKIQQKCKTIFKLHAPKSSQEQQLLDNFSKSNFSKCEQLITQVNNPYALNFSLADIRSLLEWKNAAQNCKKLVRFLHNHPQTQPKFYHCQSFILNPQYISYLAEVVDKIDGQIIIEKFNNTIKKQYLSIKKHTSLQILQKTVIDMMKNKQNILKIKNLLHQSFKNRQDDFAVLLKLFLILFSRLQKQNRNHQDLKNYGKFFTQLNGEFQLKDKQKSNKFITKNLVYIFPYFVNNTQITNPLTHYNSLLIHYRSVLISFSSIQKQIGSNRYFLLLCRSLLQSSKTCQNKGLFIEQYLKIHLLLQGNEELSLKQQDKQKYKQILLQILQLVNKIAQTKTRQNNAKLQYPFLNGYISHLLFIINQGVVLDVTTLQIINSVSQNLDTLISAEDYKVAVRDALQWISKHIEKSIPTTVKIQKSPIKQQIYASSKPKEEEYVSKVSNNASENVPQQKKQLQTQYKSYQSIKKNDQPRNLQAQQQQSYIKYRQIQQQITIKQTYTTNKTTVVLLNQSSTNSLFNQQIQKPKEQTFNQDKFYKGTPQTPSNPSQTQRKDNLQKVQKIVTGQNSISSLKDHCKFVSSLALLTIVSQSQFTQLQSSIESITQTASSHPFYVRKVSQYQTSIKLVRIYKTMWRSNNKKNCQILVIQMLKLFLAMSKMKERKQIIFNQEETVQFFKMVVKRKLNSQGQIKEMQYLTQILYNCRNNNEIFFSFGLISMLVQLINRDKDTCLTLILQYFIKIDLTPQIINEIYQRGTFNTLVQTFASSLTTYFARKVLSLWIRLAGKVCINQSIQQKFRSTNLHLLVWSKITVLTSPAQRKDIAYFYAYLCLKNQSITQWMMQSKVPQQILSNLGELTENEQLYLLFYHFCFGNNINRDYCFRVKYHVHLINRLNLRYNELKQNEQTIHLNKYFYKSLGQLMTSPMHLSTFFKEEVVRKLIDIYNVKCQPCIFESLLDFISALQTQPEFDQLKRQNFWDSLKIFEFKISSEATYSYLLQIFLIMIKKGRTKQFSTAQLRNKVCLKAQFSINMQGKQLALRFILALSIKDKENYFNQRSIGLLASVLGFKVSRNQLQLTQDILKVEGASKNQEFLNYFLSKDNNIHALISQNAEKLTPQQLKIALSILLTLSINASSKKEIADICAPTIKRLLQKQQGQNYTIIIQLLGSLSKNSSNKDTFQFLQIDKLILNNQTNINKAKENDCLNQFNQLCKNIQKMKGAVAVQVNNQQGIKKAVASLRQGKKVKMYKTDGSISELLIFISFDCLELNCAVTLSEVVKQKWRLPLNQITKIIQYTKQESNQFQNSYFQKNSGFFTKAPNCDQCLSLLGKNNEFHICFLPGEKQQWKINLQIVKQYARNLLYKVSNK